MKTVVVGTAGHIDHGKSALVRALTGIDPDRLKEEKARGITIDLGFAHVGIGDTNVAFVDVPGHERFVKNMLAGVGGTVVTGTLVSGRIRVDDELLIAPGDTGSGAARTRSVKVRGVQVHGARRDEAIAGQRSAVNLGGVEVDEIGRGQNLVRAEVF